MPDLTPFLQAASGTLGSGSLLVVLWMLANGKLVAGSVHEDLRNDRDFYRERFQDSADMLANLLESLEVKE